MAKITKFDRTNLKTLRTEMDAALTKVLAKHGLSADLGRISFGESDFNVKLTVNCGSNDDAAEREFGLYAARFGLTADLFGKSFKQGGDSYTIVGIKPKSFKYPVLAKNSKGKTYKFTPQDAALAV